MFTSNSMCDNKTLRKLVYAINSFLEETIEIFIGNFFFFFFFFFSFFRLKHTLWVRVRTASLNEYPQCMSWIRNKKKMYTPANPSCYIKVGMRGYTFHGHFS